MNKIYKKILTSILAIAMVCTMMPTTGVIAQTIVGEECSLAFGDGENCNFTLMPEESTVAYCVWYCSEHGGDLYINHTPEETCQYCGTYYNPLGDIIAFVDSFDGECMSLWKSSAGTMIANDKASILASYPVIYNGFINDVCKDINYDYCWNVIGNENSDVVIYAFHFENNHEFEHGLCKYCKQEEPPVDLSIFSNKCFYGHRKETPIPGIIMTDYNATDKTVTVELAFASTSSEKFVLQASDIEKDGNKAKFSYENNYGLTFYCTATVNGNAITGITISYDGDYDVVCDTLVPLANVKTDKSFVSGLQKKFAPYYALTFEGEMDEFTCEVIDGNLSIYEGRIVFVPNGKYVKLSNDKYILCADYQGREDGTYAIFEVTLDNKGNVSVLNYAGYEMEVAEKPKTINEINLLIQNPVAAGKKVKDLTFSTDTKNLSIVSYYIYDEYSKMADEDVLEAGNEYELHVIFKASNDYFFKMNNRQKAAASHNASVKINGVLETEKAGPGKLGYVYDETNNRIGAVSYENKKSNIYGEIGYIFTPEDVPDASLKPDTTIKQPSTSEVINITPDIKDNDLSAKLSDSNDDLKTALEISATDDGVWAWMELKAKEVNSADVPSADKTLIAAGLNGKTLGAYLDISIFKQVAGQSKTKMNQKLNEKVTISVTVPSSLRAKGKDFAIVYTHDGGAAKTILPESYNESTGELVFRADEFSTYALVYTPKSVTPTPEPTPTPTPTTPYKAPNTGVR